jgi:hypothetical protein
MPKTQRFSWERGEKELDTVDKRYGPCHLVEDGDSNAGKLPKRVPGEMKRRLDSIDSESGGSRSLKAEGEDDRHDLSVSA